LTEQDPSQDQQRRRRQAQQRERCPLLRQQRPPRREVAEAEQDERDRGRGEQHPDNVDPDARLARDGREAKAQDKDHHGQHDEQPVRVPPAQGRGEEAGDEEGDRARDRRDTGQHAKRRFLLPAVVVLGDEHDEARHAGGGGNSCDDLCKGSSCSCRCCLP